MRNILSTFICGAFSSIALAVLQDAIQTIIVWLLVMFAVVCCDLFAGVSKSLKMGEHISTSKAVRNTMSKLVVYFSFVLMVALLDTATEHEYHIAKWACLLICVIEMGSIISNILKPHGIDLSLRRVLAVFISKSTAGLSVGEAEAIFKDDGASTDAPQPTDGGGGDEAPSHEGKTR